MSLDFFAGILLPIIGIIVITFLLIFKYDVVGIIPPLIVLLIFCVSFLIFGLIFINTGSFRINTVLKEFGVKYVGDGVYKKNEFKFTYGSIYEPYATEYTLHDIDDYDINLHYAAINLGIDIEKEALQEIYKYLINYAKETENNSSLSVTKLNKKIVFSYDYKNKEFNHTIISIKKTKDDEKNDDYDSLYVYSTLSLDHKIDDDEFDNNLLMLLFNQDMKDFYKKKSKDYDNITYTGKARLTR